MFLRRVASVETGAVSALQAFAYTRVSTEKQADSGLGVDAQLGVDLNWSLGGELVDAGISGAIPPPERRPALGPALDELLCQGWGEHTAGGSPPAGSTQVSPTASRAGDWTCR